MACIDRMPSALDGEQAVAGANLLICVTSKQHQVSPGSAKLHAT